MNQDCHTDFAPAARAAAPALAAMHERLCASDCGRVLDTVDAMVFVLEEHRQIVFANRAAREHLKVPPQRSLLGERPGEALDCINADLGAGGCGTSRWCRDCGAVRAMLQGVRGRRDVEECRLTRRTDGRVESLDLLVSAAPFGLDGERYTIFTLTDVSHEKHRAVMERIFFHDLLNLAGGMHSLVREFARLLPAEQADLGQVLQEGLARLLEEIVSQKELSAAESGELACRPGEVRSLGLLESLAGFWRRHDAAEGRSIALDPGVEDVALVTDPTVLGRVLGNLVKNALEATARGGTVTLGCGVRDERVEFWVHNAGCMPEAVQRQVFTRAYSTKGAGRGLGTYAVQLLTAACLNGEVGFTSSAAEGTRFRLRLPRIWTPPAEA